MGGGGGGMVKFTDVVHTIAHLFLLSANGSKNSSDAQLLTVKLYSKCNLNETFAAVSVYITVCKLKVNSNFMLPFNSSVNLSKTTCNLKLKCQFSNTSCKFKFA